MLKDRRIFLLLIFTLIAVNAFTDQSFDLCEKADLVFRDGPVIGGINWGHTGIYCDWSSGNPIMWNHHNVVEATTVGDSICREILLSDFSIENPPFWGASTHLTDYFKKKAIVKFVRLAVDSEYKYNATTGYKGPNTYRCDGLAEAAYESQGLDIVPVDTWMTLSPRLQFDMTPVADAVPPDIPSTYPADGNVVTGEITLRAVLDEWYYYASGPRLAKFYIDNEFAGEDEKIGGPTIQYSCTWNSNSVDDGGHTLLVKGYDQAGIIGEKEVTFFVNNSIPIIVSTDPADGAIDVNVYAPITIGFNKEIDQSTVNSGTVLFNPSLHSGFSTEWSGDGKTVTLTLTNTEEDLEFSTDYTVTVTDGVKDTSGTQLDGDRDGEPGGNYEFSFTTRSPEFELSIPSWLHKVELDSTATIDVFVTNDEKREIFLSGQDNIVYDGNMEIV